MSSMLRNGVFSSSLGVAVYVRGSVRLAGAILDLVGDAAWLCDDGGLNLNGSRVEWSSQRG